MADVTKQNYLVIWAFNRLLGTLHVATVMLGMAPSTLTEVHVPRFGSSPLSALWVAAGFAVVHSRFSCDNACK
jgi:hypothetical protein